MDLVNEIWNAINATPNLSESIKQSLHIEILRLVEESKKPTGKRLGVTMMTQEASLAGDRVASNRKHKGKPTDAKPKSI